MPRPLSTTAYAVLGMLALRPATPYELTQQMQRSLDYCWPTSERSLYEQPERLVAAGLAAVAVEGEGSGARRRYSITPAGRVALRAWLATESAPPRFQNEPLLRALFADQGTLDDLHRVLHDLRVHVEGRRRAGIAQMTPYLEGDGLFQERADIVVVVAGLIFRVMTALDDWAASVQELTANWDTTADRGLSPEVRSLLEQLLADEQARVDAAEG